MSIPEGDAALEEIKGILIQYLHAIQESQHGPYQRSLEGADDLINDLQTDLAKISRRIEEKIYP